MNLIPYLKAKILKAMCEELKPGESSPGKWTKSLHAVTPACFTDSAGNIITAYTITDAEGEFFRWIVLSGPAALVDVLDPTSLTPVCPSGSSLEAVVLPKTCISVNGEPQHAIPVVIFDPAQPQNLSQLYLDSFGVQIQGNTQPASPCDCPETDCPQGGPCEGFSTFLQSDWGNPLTEAGTIVLNEWATLLGGASNITLGCASNTVVFDNAADVLTYLPDYSPLVAISGPLTNPTTPQSILLGELLALKLNILADQNIPGFSIATTPLSSLTYTGSPGTAFNNQDINTIVALADQVLGGCFPLPIADALEAVQNINQNYLNGTDLGLLDCPFDN